MRIHRHDDGVIATFSESEQSENKNAEQWNFETGRVMVMHGTFVFSAACVPSRLSRSEKRRTAKQNSYANPSDARKEYGMCRRAGKGPLQGEINFTVKVGLSGAEREPHSLFSYLSISQAHRAEILTKRTEEEIERERQRARDTA